MFVADKFLCRSDLWQKSLPLRATNIGGLLRHIGAGTNTGKLSVTVAISLLPTDPGRFHKHLPGFSRQSPGNHKHHNDPELIESDKSSAVAVV